MQVMTTIATAVLAGTLISSPPAQEPEPDSLPELSALGYAEADPQEPVESLRALGYMGSGVVTSGVFTDGDTPMLTALSEAGTLLSATLYDGGWLITHPDGRARWLAAGEESAWLEIGEEDLQAEVWNDLLAVVLEDCSGRTNVAFAGGLPCGMSREGSKIDYTAIQQGDGWHKYAYDSGWRLWIGIDGTTGLRWNPRLHRARIGVTTEALSPALATQLGLPEDEGVLITSVVPGEAGERAGLRRWDVVLLIDGVSSPEEHVQSPASQDSLRAALRVRQPGDPLRLSVIRGAALQEIELEVGGEPVRLPRMVAREAPHGEADREGMLAAALLAAQQESEDVRAQIARIDESLEGLQPTRESDYYALQQERDGLHAQLADLEARSTGEQEADELRDRLAQIEERMGGMKPAHSTYQRLRLERDELRARLADLAAGQAHSADLYRSMRDDARRHEYERALQTFEEMARHQTPEEFARAQEYYRQLMESRERAAVDALRERQEYYDHIDILSDRERNQQIGVLERTLAERTDVADELAAHLAEMEARLTERMRERDTLANEFERHAMELEQQLAARDSIAADLETALQRAHRDMQEHAVRVQHMEQALAERERQLAVMEEERRAAVEGRATIEERLDRIEKRLEHVQALLEKLLQGRSGGALD